jgi:hypothetical protein
MPCACCGNCFRCIINDEWDCHYTDQASCEQCDSTTYCENLDTLEVTTVADCEECVGENVFCYTVTDGPCGTWQDGFPCVPCPCDSGADCPSPNTTNTCEEAYPEYPYLCCDGECKQWACYPGATITLHFRKPSGCVDPAGIFDEIPDEGEFDLVIDGGSVGCADSAELSSAPCSTQWTLSTGCVVSDLTFQATGSSTCETCYELLGWEAARTPC